MYNLFQCKEDYETASFDPEQNEVLREEFAVIADFAADPEAVDLKLLGENQVRLEVSEGISELDGGEWIRNLSGFLLDEKRVYRGLSG